MMSLYQLRSDIQEQLDGDAAAVWAGMSDKDRNDWAVRVQVGEDINQVLADFRRWAIED